MARRDQHPLPAPFEVRVGAVPLSLFVAVTVASFALAGLVDGWVWRASSALDPAICHAEWFLALRVLGYLPVWLVAGMALFLVDWQKRPLSLASSARALLLSGAVLGAGCLGEGLKLVIRRLRPGVTGGEHVWRSFADDPFSTSDLGLPSGHAVIAFAAAWVLCRLFPAASGLWIALACGCGATRVLSGSHFLSDVVLAAAMSFAVVRFAWACHLVLRERWGATAAVPDPTPGAASPSS